VAEHDRVDRLRRCADVGNLGEQAGRTKFELSIRVTVTSPTDHCLPARDRL